MTRAEVIEKIKEVVIVCFPDMANIEMAEDTIINKDTGIDSMGFIFIICKLEAMFDVKIPERQWPKLQTLGDVADAIMKRIK